MGRPDRIVAGSIHVVFEGYFVYNNPRMPSMQDFFGQLWKEYALSDSRYMTSDPLVLVRIFRVISPHLNVSGVVADSKFFLIHN
jgi:hypothetical protein